MSNEIVLRSLIDYLEVIERNEIGECYFRGESKKYNRIIASCYRKNLIDLESYVIDEMIDEYFYEVSSKLTSLEKNNFIAYSQHHGLPTNLIDITSSPLVALYFACQGNEIDNGFVYMFDKHKFLNFSDELSGKSIVHIYNKLIEYDDSIILLLFEKLLDSYDKSGRDIFSIFLIKYLKDYKNVITDSNIEFTVEVNELLKIIDEILEKNAIGILYTDEFSYIYLDKFLEVNVYKNNNFYNFRNIYHSLESSVEILYEYVEYPKEQIIFFLSLFVFLLNNSIKNNGLDQPEFPLILYTPEIKFDRMKLQSGKFIYQNFLEDVNVRLNNGNPENLAQKIDYDQKIEIKNKSKILSQLDILGINKATLFGDSDNIASYIYEKYNGYKMIDFNNL